ncbi:unnamed protein product [Aureobasidium uvarum]|uniref:Uncharacterized protein n=1 Tax=Aureobasidium uvarum TaxID=2773716 RepID=A0A9N8KIZ2_9PEZI|nr:unnamed protein product [Aureobasidium uvarum]
MPRQRNTLPYVCFAPEGELHSNCQNEPFTNDATHHADNQSKVWIGYRNELDTSYNGRLTFRQVLAQAKANLSQAMNAKANSSKRAQWLEAFPGVATKASNQALQQLQRGRRALKQATCPNAFCKARGEILQMEWIAVESNFSSSTNGFLVGYIFHLQGQEMITICRNYYFDLYRFQREDGTVSPDMFLRTVRSEPSPQTEVDAGRSARRRSDRLQGTGALDDEEDPVTGSSTDENSTTPPHTAVDSSAQPSPSMSIAESRQSLEDDANDQEEEAAPARTLIGPLSAKDEYQWMICQICHTYGVRVLRLPEVTTHVNTLEQAVREDNRLALCHAFARIMTILVTTSAHVTGDFLDEEYETMVSSAVAEFGMDFLSRAEGTIFMERMGAAMIAGQRGRLGMAYAALRGAMLAYAGLV